MLSPRKPQQDAPASSKEGEAPHKPKVRLAEIGGGAPEPGQDSVGKRNKKKKKKKPSIPTEGSAAPPAPATVKAGEAEPTSPATVRLPGADLISGIDSIEIRVTPVESRNQRTVLATTADGKLNYSDVFDTDRAKFRAAFVEAVAKIVPLLESEKPQLEQRILSEAEATDAAAEEEGAADGRASDGVLRLVEDVEFFCAPDDQAFATFEAGDGYQTIALKSRKFEQFLAHRFFKETGKPLPAQVRTEVILALEARAEFEGARHEVFSRVGKAGNSVYVDLGRDDFRAVKITAKDWKVISTKNVRFRRSGGIQEMPLPEKGGDLQLLGKYVNVRHEDRCLLHASVVSFLNPNGPFPILAVFGEHGTAKSTLLRVIRNLIDPRKPETQGKPRDDRDLAIRARNSWFLAFDNLSNLPEWLSDAFCRLVSGGGLVTRQLFSDAEETLFDETRPVALNGIDEVVVRDDAISRMIALELEPIPAEKRQTERSFWADFERDRPKILGALFSAVSCAIRNREAAEESTRALPRMADFAVFAVAAGEELGYTQEEILAAMARNQARAKIVALEASPLYLPIRSLLRKNGRTWTGTATALLKALTPEGRIPAGWPQTPASLSNKLRHLMSVLPAVGITAEVRRETSRDREKIWTLTMPQQGETTRRKSADDTNGAE